MNENQPSHGLYLYRHALSSPTFLVHLLKHGHITIIGNNTIGSKIFFEKNI